MNPEEFRRNLLSWYDLNKREMPWRDIQDPYKTWISEIMLQQTRVDQAAPYFERFMKRFPDVYELAKASQQEVLKVWEGLGYYSRARNMHQSAKKVVEDYEGEIPDSYKEITSLKGIGPYTASAVLSIAYNKPYAVVDGNVIRVLSRYFGIEDDVRATSTKKQIQNRADELQSKKRPGDFNQALMELGAVVCKPSNPDCINCPLQTNCIAANQVKTETIPYKSPKKKRPHHHIGIGIIVNESGKVLIALRPDDAMLGGLWEFPGGKQKKEEDIKNTVIRELKEELDVKVEVKRFFMKLNHAYSHFTITLHAYLCGVVCGEPKPSASQQIEWVSIDQLANYPFPKANRKITEKLMNGGQTELFL